ncbi:hypothetical protein [Methanosarcina mazei]|uniref:Uncharacterized protein n=1 Tax=Methanosarcina mazei TaxID=2209 RepID=A0A0F8I3I6_METMZ|nr:hypothetical protein [Methanosarcina mazei]KKG75621.1 hypothetical protein DU46_17725 [Methanosarcina mazei]KKG84512.1 hypothetical protein DU61_18275 [Methanosarcina mazei]KKH07221.1 hypothetical protein DU62_16010 [Methanosarcina mazei]KKH09960.1 hypothetical protein DU51_00560 [Methanosarcina mazei]
MNDSFSNREAAIIFWIVIFATYFLLTKRIRDSIIDVIKVALNKHIFGYVVFYLIYICLFTYVFYYLKWWNASNLKDTAMWFTFCGLQIGYSVVRSKIEYVYWKNLILENLAFIEFEKFFISLYNFSFKVELVLIPIMILAVLLNFYLKRKEFADKELDILRYLVNKALILLGILLLLYSFYRAISNPQSIANTNILKSFLLPVVYATISIPFMYALKLYSGYEDLFCRLNFGTKRSKKLNLLIKWRLILFCNFDIRKLQTVASTNGYNLLSISSKDEIDDLIKSYESVLLRE